MFFTDKFPCLGLDFDAFIADVKCVNKSFHSEDLKLAVQSIITNKKPGDNQHGQHYNKAKNNSVNRSKWKPKASASLFLCCFLITCIGFGCLFALPVICYEILGLIDMVLRACLNLNVPHLHRLQGDVLFKSLIHFRKMAMYLRFQETFSVTEFDFDECILDNPLHKIMLQTPMSCELCREFDDALYTTTDSTSVTRDSLPLFQPIVFQNQGTELNLEQLQNLLMKNTQMMNSNTVSLLSNRPYIQHVEDFMKENVLEQLHQDSGIHIYWRSLSYISAHILRSVVPQPHQFFANVLRSYRSMININGHLSPPFELHPSHKGHRFLLIYAQLSGSRRLVFSPVQHCADTCSSFTVVTKPKDVVIFNRHSWTVSSEAFEDDTSLSFTDEFDLVHGLPPSV